MTISVLYIHPLGSLGGASRSLLDMVAAFPAGAIRPRAVAQRGRVAQALAKAGFEVITARGLTQFDNTRFGHYRGGRWLVLLREAWFLPFTLWALLRARWRWSDIDLIHVNEVTLLPAAVVAKVLFARPLVVHVRSVQEVDRAGLRRSVQAMLLRKFADRVVAIDRTVRASLPPDLNVDIVYNGFSPGLDLGQEAGDYESQRLGMDEQTLKLAMVGKLHPAKGVRELLEAVRICRQRNLDVHLVIAGDNVRTLEGVRGWLLSKTGFARDLHAEVGDFIAQHGLADSIDLIGFIADVGKLYDAVDVVCFPSRLDAAGRPVFEAAFSKVPSIVAIRRPYGDTIVDGETGLCVEPAAESIAAAITYFHDHRGEVGRMGENAYRLAQANFTSERNSARMLEIYRAMSGSSAKGGEAG